MPRIKGRLYHPIVGCLLSADPLIQFTTSTQSYNRYTYVLNNPLSLTDPSGYLAKGAFAAFVHLFNAEELGDIGEYLPSLPQELVDGIAGFGDGTFRARTLGAGDLGEIRDILGIDGGVNENSSLYSSAHLVGSINGGAALGSTVDS